MTFKDFLAGLIASIAIATPVFAEGDIKSGKKVFKKCKACHTVKEGKNKVGPSLFNIVDAPAGSVADFKYSDAMAQSGLIWDEATLTAFLTKPKDVVPKTTMAFPGLKKEEQIVDLIAYLRDEAKASE